MDVLKGKVVNVVLTIQEGRGMENLKNQTFISANFNGRILESDPVEAEDCPLFNSNLIWEIEKRDLRKIRSSNQPLRVECLTVDEHNRREKFGHVLLNVRSAQIIEENTQQITFKWQKLIGVRNKKRNCFPELFVALTIRNHIIEDTQEIIEEAWEPEPRVVGCVPIEYLEDGYIMVGEKETSNEDYSLNIVIKAATSLDLLLPEVLVFNQNRHRYFMHIKIFGIPITTKQFSKDLHDKIVFDEKIVVRLKSNEEFLKKFFDEEKFDIGFYCGNDVLGITTVSFEGLTESSDTLYLSNCHFRFPSPNGIVPESQDNRKPSISLEIFLKKNQVANNADVTKACGDYNEVPNQLLLEVTEQHVKELEEWKERQKQEFEEDLKRSKEEEFAQERAAIEDKKTELDESIKKCSELQQELQEKLDELNLSRALKKKRKSSTEIISSAVDNQKKFADCDKELLIDYITKLQEDNENLKEIICEHKQEIENMKKTALTKEQTTNLLQELKGLEEKFEEAQKAKTYFKEQWQRACQEIHNMKAEDYKQLQLQLEEQREELKQIDTLRLINASTGSLFL